MAITKGERTELRSVVKQQFKVLRAEVIQRQAELLTGVEDEIGEKYSEDDKVWADVQHRIQEAVLTANREVNNALYVLLQLDRQEADLLRSLSVGALESEEAHRFLAAIPTVSELVPAARLAELERAMGDDGNP